MKTIAILLALIFLSAAVLVNGQGVALKSMADYNNMFSQCMKATRMDPANVYCNAIAAFLAPTTQAQFNGGQAALENPLTNPVRLAQVIALEGLANQVQTLTQLESQRLDMEQGAPPSADGSTNLVSKPGAPQLLSLAVQSGALTQSQNGNTTTVQANVDQLVRFIGGSAGPLIYTNGGTPLLKNVSAYSTLTMSAPATTVVPTSGSATANQIGATTASGQSTATRLASLTVRYQFENKYDPKSAAFQTAYAKALAQLTSTALLAGSLTKYFTGITAASCTSYQTSASLADTIRAIDTCLNDSITQAEIKNKLQLSNLVSVATNLTSAVMANAQLYRQAIATAAGMPFTFEYVYNRPQSQPDTHDFRGIVAWNAGAGILNANIDGTIYGSQRPSNARYGRFKDVQMSAEFDRSFSLSSPNSPSWSIAGYGQWQNSPSVIDLIATSVPTGITLPPNAQSFITGTRGWLGVVQAKITLKLGTSQIPIAAKWSNQTSLLDKGSFGGQFGLTYDLSQLKQLFGASSSQ